MEKKEKEEKERLEKKEKRDEEKRKREEEKKYGCSLDGYYKKYIFVMVQKTVLVYEGSTTL